ncbi:MAG: RIP metalloprotease RseP [Candidatus Liberibacter europaeus]|uniref:RIP metalloprotease RseP n=1 Tax=Candidatus Liberibacter europaeus TaxID=744859 RepID=A0A2T4VZ27_9HYPH|nr:RIP metalloprotease RseP [Candidatus Liberibacter europaeus]PTL87030.1 MAG: RIP metalloprotease RseP [Candidatus Liberibacter europaeus]
MISVFLEYFFSYIVDICVIVIVHEFGHYVVARLCGVRVLSFSVGFGPEIVGFTDYSGVRWKISLFPLGGYVSFVDNESDRDSFSSIAHWKKMLVALAGPFANVCSSVLILTFLFYRIGVQIIDPIVSNIVPGSPAAIAGIKPGDRILSVNGMSMSNAENVETYFSSNTSKEIPIILNRDHVGIVKLNVVPRIQEIVDGFSVKRQALFIGAYFKNNARIQNISIMQALLEGLSYSFSMAKEIFHVLYIMFSGGFQFDQIIGPIGVIKISKSFYEKGLNEYMFFLAEASLSVALFNLIPIPILDGGNFLIYFVEMIRRKPLGEKSKAVIFGIGFLIILALVVTVLRNDIYELNI